MLIHIQIVNGTYPAGLGEPLNVILSAESDAAVLETSLDHGGFLNFMLYAALLAAPLMLIPTEARTWVKSA